MRYVFLLYFLIYWLVYIALTWRLKSVGALFVNAQSDGAVLKFDVATGAFVGAIINSVPDALEALALSSC